MPKVCLLSHLEADNLDPLDGDIPDLEDASQQIEWRLAGAVEDEEEKKVHNSRNCAGLVFVDIGSVLVSILRIQMVLFLSFYTMLTAFVI